MKKNLWVIILIHVVLLLEPEASIIGIPEPEEMLRLAEVVGVGTLKRESGQWMIQFSRLLKGDWKTAVWIPLAEPGPTLNLDYFGRMVGDQPCLFLALKHSEKAALVPAFWMVSAWPQGRPRDSRLDSLEGSVKYAESVMAGQRPHGKNTMPADAVLPPRLPPEQIAEFRKELEAEAKDGRPSNRSAARSPDVQIAASQTGPPTASRGITPGPASPTERSSKVLVVSDEMPPVVERWAIPSALAVITVAAGVSWFLLNKRR